MHNAAAAEWILSLIVAPDRAASTVGDLVEEASSRGTLWFRSCVLRTAGSHLWNDLTISPLRMVRLTFWGVAANWVLSGVFSLLLSMWWRVDIYLSAPDGGTQPSPWVYPVALVAMCTAWPLLAGWELGRRADGRELSAALAVATLFAAFYVVSINFSALQVRQIGKPWPGMEHALAATCARALFVIAGAMLFRQRRHKVAYSRVWR